MRIRRRWAYHPLIRRQLSADQAQFTLVIFRRSVSGVRKRLEMVRANKYILSLLPRTRRSNYALVRSGSKEHLVRSSLLLFISLLLFSLLILLEKLCGKLDVGILLRKELTQHLLTERRIIGASEDAQTHQLSTKSQILKMLKDNNIKSAIPVELSLYHNYGCELTPDFRVATRDI